MQCLSRFPRRMLCCALTFAGCVLACERYEPPPTVTIDGLQNGLLYDSRAPLVLSFGQPIDVSTLSLKVVALETNADGELPDEDDAPNPNLKIYVAHDAVDGDIGGHIEVVGDGSSVRFVHDAALPVGPKLAVIVEPGVKGTGGRVRVIQTRIPFAYSVRCSTGKPVVHLTSGVYFVLLEVVQPLGTQIQLYGAIDVDSATGAFVGQFTNADRNPNGARCPTPCSAIDRCRLLPSPACVPPSTRAGTVDEYTDFVPNSTPPTGYSFAVEGCAVDEGGSAGLLTAPATMIVQSPQVTVGGLTMTASFSPDAEGTSRASGSLTADAVYLGTTKLGAGSGSMAARRIPAGEVPQGVPPAQAAPTSSDAGAAGDASN